MSESWFYELRTRARVRTAGRAVQADAELRSGGARTVRRGSDVEVQWWDTEPGAAPPALPEPVRAAAAEARGAPGPADAPRVEALIHQLQASLPADVLELSARSEARWVVHASAEAQQQQCQRHLIVALTARAGAGGAQRRVLRERAFASADAAVAGLGSLVELGERAVEDAQRRLSGRPAPRGAICVVIPPGADAGVFFHEICGHPLEGDVVVRRASFLATREGQVVAPEFVDVFDDPTRATGGVAYRFDDEGSPSSPAPLLRGGRVAGALLDAKSAGQLRRRPTGHGRRASHRFAPLPRMANTFVAPHEGTLEEILQGVEQGLLVTHLSPAFVALGGGAFSFHVDEARLIERGRVGDFVGPCLLQGHALEALAAIDRVGADVGSFFGLKGCGKLDQGDLPVSFEHPTVRFRELWLEPRE
jgi:TldD protein